MIRTPLTILSAVLCTSSAMATDSLCGSSTTDLFGPNVCVFQPNTNGVQNIVDAVHNHQKTDEFGMQGGYALLFTPGQYDVHVPVGYSTEVLGLGQSPDNTQIRQVESTDKSNGTVLTQFWRGAENFATTADGDAWAVSQAAALRRAHIKGTLALGLGPGIYASGGFFADTEIDGHVESREQQQWMSRNSSFGGWVGAVWNMVFAGDTGAPTQNDTNTTVIPKTPSGMAEKPFLIYKKNPSNAGVNAIDNYQVVIPPVTTNDTQGTDWGDNGPTYSIQDHEEPLSDFFIAKPSDTAETINESIQGKKGIIFEPGRYDLGGTIDIPNTNSDQTFTILGLGLPTLISHTGKTIIQAPEKRGNLRIGGIILEAGSNSDTLLKVGTDSTQKSSNTPASFLYDTYCRVGGASATSGLKAGAACIAINNDNVTGDNLWLWRADHGAGAGWSLPGNTGLVVNGNNVTMFGLAVEHFKTDQTIWNGSNGRVYFYQSEMPYQVPAGTPASPALTLNTTAQHFQGFGLGVYSNFLHQNVHASCAIHVDTQDMDVSLKHLVDVHLNNAGYIQHFVNQDGQQTSPNNGSPVYDAQWSLQ